MKAASRAFGPLAILAACIAIMPLPSAAQKPATGADAEKTRQILTTNAHALESRGRPDMAIQIWQQILLSDPKNAEALAGLARDYKLSGSSVESDKALQKLKEINPNDPNIGRIQAMTSTRTQSDKLRQAGELARQGRNEDAMRIYRDLFGDRPPDGEIALAYYQTLYGTASGKDQAIAAMRELAARNPGDSRFAVELGTLLTYDARTRAEGIRILQEHSNDPNARAPLRQALIWDSANPASAAQLREYLKTHPGDADMAARLKENEQKLAQMNSGIARTPEEKAAFAALNAKKLEDAESRFNALLAADPKNGRAAAGMGFLRMQQNNFGAAINFLSQAEENGYHDPAVTNALATSRFWYTMGDATQALDDNQLDVASAKYRDALAMRPKSPEALSGLAGVLTKAQQYGQAANVYDQLLKSQPGSADAWRGLFLSYARDGENQKALAVSSRFPAGVKTALSKDPEYLRTLATIYHSEGRSADAQRVLAAALALPFPDNGENLKQDTRLQYAGILMEARRYDQAAAMYTQIVNEDSGYLPAWMGLVSAHHQLNQDNAAIADVERMPPATYETALNDPGFLNMLGSIYQQANQFDIAQGLLERAAKLETAAGGQPSVQLQLQLAAIYMQRNNTDQAYAIYRQVLTANPERLDAWKGLIATLQTTNHTNEALQQIALIPPAIRQKLEMDFTFVQTEASLYAAAGDTVHAIDYMNRVNQHYAQTGQTPPPDLAIQNAWLLYNTRNDRALYPALMKLGSRQDLTAAQRETVQTIWANWSVRRAGTAIDNNDNDRAVQILEAAAQAFPENVEVKRVLAGGYVRIGEMRQALNIYKSLSMQDASAADFQGGIGAALAAGDKAQAETWLRQGLERYPRDYQILSMAARYEQSRGDNQRAADYWKAALAVMPQASPTDRLAHVMAYPDANTRPHKAVTANDLQRLLDPNAEPFPKTTKLPPLPAYGPDPYVGGAAPVIPGNTPRSQQTPAAQLPVVPPTAEIPLPVPSAVSSAAANASQAWTPPAQLAESGSSARPRKRRSAGGQDPNSYTGVMHIPPSEENISSTEAPAAGQTAARNPYPANGVQPALTPEPGQTQGQQVFIPVPQSPVASNSSSAQNQPQIFVTPQQTPEADSGNGVRPALRLSAQPMDPRAAEVQALFADQTDGQLTQGSAGQIHALGNAPVALPGNGAAQNQVVAANPSRTPGYSETQYTPSAQEAATGADSAPRQQQAQPTAPVTPQPAPAQTTTATKKRKKSAARESQPVPTLATAPALQPGATQPLPGEVQQETPQPTTAQPSGASGLSDEELQQRNLPPLRGPWIKVQREPQPVSPREQVEQQLASLESGYSGWLGGVGVINFRSGDLGYDHLSALEAPFDASAPLGYHARITILVKPVFLDSGQADGTSVITVREATTSGTTLLTIPTPLGTDTTTGPATTTGTTTTSSGTPPAQQNAYGIGGEIQLALPTFAIAGGYTPYGFLVANWNGRASWRPGNGPFTFTGSRDSVKDSQLSYGGLRDPGTASLSYPGTIWGGVVANQGNVQFARGDAMSGVYVGVGGQYLTGYNVQSNSRVDGSAGAYWRILTKPEYGNLSIGANFFGMHYTHNQQAYTFGMGGYFSPQAYFLANIPFTWSGHYLTRWHYEILGGLGVQAFQQDLTPLWPLAGQKALLIAMNNASLPALTSVGPNYNVRSTVSYQIGPHWFAGGFVTANNSRNYAAVSAGFSIHYMFRAQPSTVTAPTGMFPTDGLRPFSVP